MNTTSNYATLREDDTTEGHALTQSPEQQYGLGLDLPETSSPDTDRHSNQTSGSNSSSSSSAPRGYAAHNNDHSGPDLHFSTTTYTRQGKKGPLDPINDDEESGGSYRGGNTGNSPLFNRHQSKRESGGRNDGAFPLSPPLPLGAKSPDVDMNRAKSAPDGLGRFRRAAHHAVAARRFSTYQMRGQGVDVSDMDSIFSCIEATVNVTTVDLSESRFVKKQGMDNKEFLEWLQTPTYVACQLLTLMETSTDGQERQVDPTTVPHGIEPDMLQNRLPLEKLDHFRFQYPPNEDRASLKVQMEQVTMFLLQDGTLITLFQVSGNSVIAPIVERLSHDYSLVRKNNDASFLLQSVIDGIVDHAIPITDAFRQEINDLEMHILALPRMKFTRELHRMTSQLGLLKRTLAPTQALVHALLGRNERSPLTSLARTYMGDVMDHCNTMVEDIDSMLALCENLINMIFNLVAYDTNESMRRLALVSIIFLPITFVAGVYGTNFENFTELSYGISYFWIICGVVTALV
ncbi:hypothetical protein BGW38_004740, partial [Lunasporangiospora selenospora]